MATHLPHLWNCTAEELNSYIQRALELKKESRDGISHRQLAGKTVGIVGLGSRGFNLLEAAREKPVALIFGSYT